MKFLTVMLSMLGVFQISYAQNESFSLMFQQSEVEQIKLKRQQNQKSIEHALHNEDVIFVGGIVYLNDQQWTVWINDQVITPEAIDAHFQINKVSTDQVTFIYHLSGATGQITLPINHSYMIETKQMILGDMRSQMVGNSDEELYESFEEDHDPIETQ